MSYKIFCLNIGNPSIERAKKQMEWLENNEYDTLILTEYKKSSGGIFIKETLLKSNYLVFENLKTKNEYGVLIATKNKDFVEKRLEIDFLPERLVFIKNKVLSIMGVYVPANDKNKEIRKKTFIENLLLSIKKYKPSIICGDFNTIFRTHIPKYKQFKEWEYEFMDNLKKLGYEDKSRENDYSWFGRNGNNYKYDYFFVLKIRKINYNVLYSKETIKLKLTDHAILKVNIL